LNGKVDLEALENLERMLIDKLNDLVTALKNQFADKAETKKALKLLKDQLKNLYDLVMAKQAERPKDDDAMFTTKPL